MSLRSGNLISKLLASFNKSLTDVDCSFRDDWAMKHFLHPKLLRKAREVRAQLEDIMKFQKMELYSAGTDFDVLRFIGSLRLHPFLVLIDAKSGKRSRPDTSTRRHV